MLATIMQPSNTVSGWMEIPKPVSISSVLPSDKKTMAGASLLGLIPLGLSRALARVQPARILVTKPHLTTVLDLRNCYTCGAGNNGNVWTHTIYDLGVTQSFGYDAFNRLTSATESGSGGWGQVYVYDAFGNRAVTQASTQLDTPRTTVQNSDGTLPFNANNQWALATYDPNGTGNQTGVASDTFQYDAENRLRQSNTATYDYDGEGRRVRKTTGGTTTIYVYDA